MKLAARTSVTQHSIATGSKPKVSEETYVTSCRTTTTPSARSSARLSGACVRNMSTRASWR